MPPVVLPEAVLTPEDYITDVTDTDNDDPDKGPMTKPGMMRRDSTGSTGYSTCSSNLSSVSQHMDTMERSPRSPDSVGQDEAEVREKTKLEEEEENDGDTENNNDEDENGNEGIEANEVKPKKLSPVEFASQICANQRCLSAGFKGKRKEKGIEQIRRGSNGYNTAAEVKGKQVTPESLGEAITSVINKLEHNIKDMRVNHDDALKQLQEEQEDKFLQFTMEQEETLRKINRNIVQAEEETQRIKAQHDVAIESLKDNILKVKATDRLNSCFRWKQSLSL